MPNRNCPVGFFHDGFSFSILPVRPSNCPGAEASVLRSTPIATSPLPLQSIMSITFGLPSDVVVNPIAPGSAYGGDAVKVKGYTAIGENLMRLTPVSRIPTVIPRPSHSGWSVTNFIA